VTLAGPADEREAPRSNGSRIAEHSPSRVGAARSTSSVVGSPMFGLRTDQAPPTGEKDSRHG
jgi:hypothetical protein